MASTQDLTSVENRTAVTGEQRAGQLNATSSPLSAQLAASTTAESASANSSTQQNPRTIIDNDNPAARSTQQLPRLENIPGFGKLEGLRVQVQRAMRDDDNEMSSDFEAEMQSLTEAIHKCAEDIDAASLAQHRARDQLIKRLASSMKRMSLKKNGLSATETLEAIKEMRNEVTDLVSVVCGFPEIIETVTNAHIELEKRFIEVAQRATDAQAIAIRAENRSIAAEERLNQFLRKHGGLDDGQQPKPT